VALGVGEMREVGEVREMVSGSATASIPMSDWRTSPLTLCLRRLLGLLQTDRAVERPAEQFIDESRHRHAPFAGLVVEAGDEETIDFR